MVVVLNLLIVNVRANTKYVSLIVSTVLAALLLLIAKNALFNSTLCSLNYYKDSNEKYANVANELQIREAKRAIINKADECSNYERSDEHANVDLLIVVKSDAVNSKRRVYSRRTWIKDALRSERFRVLVLFSLGVVEDRELSAQVYAEDAANGDIIQGNFEDSDRTLNTHFILKWVSTYCQRIDYLLIVADTTVINIPQFAASFARIRASNNHSKVQMYGRLTEPALKYLDLENTFEAIYYAKYMSPNAVIYTREAVRFISAAVDDCCAPFALSAEEIFFNGLLIEELNIETVIMDDFDMNCDLPTVCESSSILMNCFRREAQCFTNWTNIEREAN